MRNKLEEVNAELQERNQSSDKSISDLTKPQDPSQSEETKEPQDGNLQSDMEKLKQEAE